MPCSHQRKSSWWPSLHQVLPMWKRCSSTEERAPSSFLQQVRSLEVANPAQSVQSWVHWKINKSSPPEKVTGKSSDPQMQRHKGRHTGSGLRRAKTLRKAVAAEGEHELLCINFWKLGMNNSENSKRWGRRSFPCCSLQTLWVLPPGGSLCLCNKHWRKTSLHFWQRKKTLFLNTWDYSVLNKVYAQEKLFHQNVDDGASWKPVLPGRKRNTQPQVLVL